MANEIIQVGNKIEIRALSKISLAETINGPEYYVSQFLQWVDRNVAMIAVPVYQNRLIPLTIDGIYDLRFYTKGGLYRCNAMVIKRSKTSNNIAVAEVKFVSALEKYQRRQYYRMECIFPMRYAVLTDVQTEMYKDGKRVMSFEQKLMVGEKLEKNELEFLNGVALDISGGGIRFNSEIQQQPGDVLLLDLMIPESVKSQIPFLFGKIIFSKRIPNRETVMYDNRVEFMEIGHSEQENIITYIFKEERNRRKRESDMN